MVKENMPSTRLAVLTRVQLWEHYCFYQLKHDAYKRLPLYVMILYWLSSLNFTAILSF